MVCNNMVLYQWKFFNIPHLCARGCIHTCGVIVVEVGEACVRVSVILVRKMSLSVQCSS
jgi:hypothetical protein